LLEIHQIPGPARLLRGGAYFAQFLT